MIAKFALFSEPLNWTVIKQRAPEFRKGWDFRWKLLNNMSWWFRRKNRVNQKTAFTIYISTPCAHLGNKQRFFIIDIPKLNIQRRTHPVQTKSFFRHESFAVSLQRLGPRSGRVPERVQEPNAVGARSLCRWVPQLPLGTCNRTSSVFPRTHYVTTRSCTCLASSFPLRQVSFFSRTQNACFTAHSSRIGSANKTFVRESCCPDKQLQLVCLGEFLASFDRKQRP